jgi:hypothetical protein
MTAANAHHQCHKQSMAWVSELESTEFQTMFISHIYATEVLRAGREILVNYGQSYCEQFVCSTRKPILICQSKIPIGIGEPCTVAVELTPVSVPHMAGSGNRQVSGCAASLPVQQLKGTEQSAL